MATSCGMLYSEAIIKDDTVGDKQFKDIVCGKTNQVSQTVDTDDCAREHFIL